MEHCARIELAVKSFADSRLTTWLTVHGARSGNRTRDLGIKSPLLCLTELYARLVTPERRQRPYVLYHVSHGTGSRCHADSALYVLFELTGSWRVVRDSNSRTAPNWTALRATHWRMIQDSNL